MSETPETDAFIEALNDDWDYEFAALTSHAKNMERERDKAREKLSHAQALLAEMQDALKLVVKQLLGKTDA